MAHEDRRGGQGGDDFYVVVYDGVDGEAFEGFGVRADFRGAAVTEAGPGGGDGGVAVRGEEGDPVLPAEACHPEAVDEEDCGFGWGVAVCLGSIGGGSGEVAHLELLSVELQGSSLNFCLGRELCGGLFLSLSFQVFIPHY